MLGKLYEDFFFLSYQQHYRYIRQRGKQTKDIMLK